MRRIAPLVLLLALGGCGYQTWSGLPFYAGPNRNKPVGNSETMRRVEGQPVQVAPLTPQPGDVWPGPPPPVPTLADIEKQTNLQPLPEEPVPGSPQNMGTAPGTLPTVPPVPTPGSSTPPALQSHRGAPPPVAPPGAPPSAAVTPPSARAPAPGTPVPTLGGTGVVTGGSKGYQSMTMPNGGSAIVIPNGNGTSTVIRSNGTIETIPTPKQ